MRSTARSLLLALALPLLGAALARPAHAEPRGTILVTGFEPFGGDPVNPSWVAASQLDGKVVGGYLVKAVRLPVDFRQVRADLDQLLPALRPVAYVAFGEDASDAHVRLEEVAHNKVNPYIPDNSGYEDTDGWVREDGAMAYPSTLPLAEIQTRLEGDGFAVERSQDPGEYVCEFTFYNGRYLAEKTGTHAPTGFVHLPSVDHPWSAAQLGRISLDIVTAIAGTLPPPPEAPPASTVAGDPTAHMTAALFTHPGSDQPTATGQPTAPPTPPAGSAPPPAHPAKKHKKKKHHHASQTVSPPAPAPGADAAAAPTLGITDHLNGNP